MNLLDLARSAITEPPAKRTATPTEKSKLRGLLEVILAECPDEIEWCPWVLRAPMSMTLLSASKPLPRIGALRPNDQTHLMRTGRKQ